MRTGKILKRLCSLLLAVTLAGVLPISAKAVTPSTEEYTVSMKDSYDVFIGNETPIVLNEGKEVYLVYTVESVDKKTTTSYQHGVVASDNVTERYMYENGGILQYTDKSGLLEEGCTYFLKFTMTEEGLDCLAVRAKGEQKEVLDFPAVYGDATDAYNYVGLWFGCGNVTAELSHVLCYDENGKDLGVYSTVASIPPSRPLQYDTEIQQAYDIKADGAWNVSLVNAKKTDAEVIFMEYTVESSDSRLYQTGVVSAKKPMQNYPHDSGILMYDNFPDAVGNGYLLEAGASYIIRFVKGANVFQAIVQKTVNGEHETYSFSNLFGSYSPEAAYVGLWFGEGVNYPVTFKITNMKCYDENGNSLGIQCNQVAVAVEQKGERTDYTGCESLYYSEEEDALVALYDDKTAKVTKNGETKEITYEIWDSTIHLNFEDGRQSFNYAYQRFYTDKVIYNRLGTYYVSFVTGTEEEIDKQTINADTGYMAMQPQKPTREGATFEGWVLADGTEYDFENVVRDSITLYAKWSDGVAYEKATSDVHVPTMPILMAGVSIVVLIVAVVIGVMLIRGGGRNERKK